MTSVSRNCLFALLAVFALSATGCGTSNNKGKIVGKWRMENLNGAPEKDMAEFKLVVFIQFNEDGTARIAAESADPRIQKALAADTKTAQSFRYKLLAGDMVEMYELPKDMQAGGGGLFGKKDRAKVKIQINGDRMTMIDDNTNLQLTKIK